MTRTCPTCKQPNLPEAAFCHNCASPLAPMPKVGVPPNQPWPAQNNPIIQQPQAAGVGAGQRAMIALALAALALLCCGPISGIPAAIVGWMELGAINRGESPAAGKWMATAGLWVGVGATVLHIVFYFIYIVFVVLAAASNPY